VNKITKARLSITSVIDLLSGLSPKRVPEHQANLHKDLKGLAGVD
jgi:phytoene synthase